MFNTLQEFYCDGQPMCSHRHLVAGTENGSNTKADVTKAVASVIKQSGPFEVHSGLEVFSGLQDFGTLIASELWELQNFGTLGFHKLRDL